MGTKKISELNEAISLNNNDLIPVVDIENEATKKITFENLKQNLNNITTGQATIDSAYINNAERNYYVRTGNVVSYNFTMRTTGTWGVSTAFLSQLPKPKYNTRFVGINHSTNSIMRFEINTSGEIQNAYSTSAPSNGHTIEGQVTYITVE